MKILLIGKNGQVGWELTRSLSVLGDVIALGRDELDLTSSESLVNVMNEVKPDWVVNAAAYTAVDKAESESDNAFLINHQAVAILAREAFKVNATLVHFSTDYVYDGEKRERYIETDATNPLSVYGESKLLGEQEIIQSGCNYFIFRTSWVFSQRGHSFIKSIIKLAQGRESLGIVADQFGTPTSAELIADVTAQCVFQMSQSNEDFMLERCGIYHLTSRGETNWHEYAQLIVKKALEYGVPLKLNVDDIKPINTCEYPVPAKRPKNSKLSIDKIEKNFSIRLPQWKHHVNRTLTELCERGNFCE